jgi:hypothetical protein
MPSSTAAAHARHGVVEARREALHRHLAEVEQEVLELARVAEVAEGGVHDPLAGLTGARELHRGDRDRQHVAERGVAELRGRANVVRRASGADQRVENFAGIHGRDRGLPAAVRGVVRLALPDGQRHLGERLRRLGPLRGHPSLRRGGGGGAHRDPVVVAAPGGAVARSGAAAAMVRRSRGGGNSGACAPRGCSVRARYRRRGFAPRSRARAMQAQMDL